LTGSEGFYSFLNGERETENKTTIIMIIIVIIIRVTTG